MLSLWLVAPTASAQVSERTLTMPDGVAVTTRVDTDAREITYAWDFTVHAGDYAQVSIEMNGFPSDAWCTDAIGCVEGDHLSQAVLQDGAETALQLDYETLAAPPRINSVTVKYAADYLFSGEFMGSAPVPGSPGNVKVSFRNPLGGEAAPIGAYTPRLVPSSGAAPAIMAPQAAQLNSGSETFAWSPGGVLANQWWLYLGSTPGRRADLFDSGPLGAARQVTIENLPLDGRSVHATLWYRNVTASEPRASWAFVERSFIAAGEPPILSAASGGSVLEGADSQVEWLGNAVQAQAWWLYAGSTPGGNDYHNSGWLPASTRSGLLAGLPGASSPVHVRLWYHVPALSSASPSVGGGLRWRYVDAEFFSSSLVVSPVAGGVLDGSEQRVVWAPGATDATAWWLYAGSARGWANYYRSGSLGPDISSANVTRLPTNGSTVWFRLWYQQGAGTRWKFQDVSLDASGSGPTFVVPSDGGSGNIGTFAWNEADPVGQEYRLTASADGRGPRGVYDPPGYPVLYEADIGAATTFTLPIDLAGPTWIRLWHRASGAAEWQFVDKLYPGFGQ